MADSPFYKAPTDEKEQPILDKVLVLRDRLLLLKQDRTQYIKSQDVVGYYDELIAYVQDINDIRTHKREEQNRLDVVLDDCFQLMSLFFLTIGRNNEAPAVYAIVSTIKRLVDHLKEAGFFTHADLGGIRNQLEKMRVNAGQGNIQHNEQMDLFLETRIANCEAVVRDMEISLSQLSPDLAPVYDKLVTMLRSLAGLNIRAQFPVEDVRIFQKQLRDIESSLKVDPQSLPASTSDLQEKFLEKVRHTSFNADGPFPGREVVLDLLGRCLFFSELMMQRRGNFDQRFKDNFIELAGIHSQLEKLSLTKAWSLRETDLYGYQRKLDRIDESRVEGNFVDADGVPAEIYEQRALLYLLRKSYAVIYHMITSSEPVSEALLPIYNQLLTLRKCLNEVKKSGGVNSPRELYPYSMKLHSLDNMREDGKFIVNGDIPEGQGSVTSLLSECFEMAYELRNDAEEQGADGSDDEYEHGHGGDLDGADTEEDDEVGEMEDHDDNIGMGLSRTVSRRPGAGPVGVSVGVK